MNLAEGVQLVSFIILTVMMLGAALAVVLTPNIVYSAFLLGAVFSAMAGLYLLLNASFVAAAQILVYVGAINVLILFAIMLVNKREDFAPVKYAWTRKIVTAAVCGGLFLLLGTTIITTPWAIDSTAAAGDEAIYILGEHFFTDFLLPFELVSVLLLMALIGAIVLARRDIIPDGDALGDDLKLPEKPRELVSAVASSESESN